MTPANDDAKRVVRNGYEAAAESYLAARPRDADDVAALAQLTERLPANGSVLDLGCGAGIPVTQQLRGAGYRVVGLDLSMRQLHLARENVQVPVAQADMAALPLRTGSFDGVVAYYSIIHVPRDEHEIIATEVHRVLAPDGHALLVLGTRDLPSDHDEDSWLGVPMYWSHYDAETNLQLLASARFTVEWSEGVTDPMGHGEHLFALVRSI